MADNNIKCCCPPSKPDKKDPFPAMSAHFAHTLDDMREQYLQAQYIDIDNETGTLDSDTLQKLLLSRTNMLVYQNRVFRFSSQEDYLYKYLNIYKLDDAESYKVQLIIVSTLTGAWEVIDLNSDSKTEIDVLKEGIVNLTTTIETEISDREAEDQKLQENIDSNKRDIETLEQGFETVDESLNTLKESVDKNAEDIKSMSAEIGEILKEIDDEIVSISEKVDNIGEFINMDGGEVEIVDGGLV